MIQAKLDVLSLLLEENDAGSLPHLRKVDGLHWVMIDDEMYINPSSPALAARAEDDLAAFGAQVAAAEEAAWEYEFNAAMAEYSTRCAYRRERKANPPSPVPLRQPKPGTVYLISGEHGKHKIGRTTQLEQRLATLRSASGLDLQVVTQFDMKDAWQAEAFLHGKFNERRATGEWFNLSEEDVNWFLSVDAAALECLVSPPPRPVEYL